jgi:hypothetical protein
LSPNAIQPGSPAQAGNTGAFDKASNTDFHCLHKRDNTDGESQFLSAADGSVFLFVVLPHVPREAVAG